MMPHQDHGVAPQRECAEEHQRPALAPPVGQPAAGVGIDGTQQGLQREKRADDGDASPGGLEVLGGEPEPQPLTIETYRYKKCPIFSSLTAQRLAHSGAQLNPLRAPPSPLWRAPQALRQARSS